MNILDMNIKDLKPYEKNPRKNENAVEYVANSIKEFGFKVPIVVDKNNVIVAGHTRYKAAKKLGLKEVPVIVADDLTEEQVKAFRLADNKVGEKAEWDFNALDNELANIFDIDMESLGFDVEDMDSNEFGTDFTLPDGDRSEIVSVTFTLHQRQKELIDYAMEQCRDSVKDTFGNTNKNGNALYEVVRQWAEQKR